MRLDPPPPPPPAHPAALYHAFTMASLLVMGGSNFRGNFSMYQLHPKRFTPDPPPGPVHCARGAQGSNPSSPAVAGTDSAHHVTGNVGQCAVAGVGGPGPCHRQPFPENVSGSHPHTQGWVSGQRHSGPTTPAGRTDSQTPWSGSSSSSSGILRDVSNQVNYHHGNDTPLQLKESTPRYRNGTAAAPAGHRDHQVPWSSSILRDVSNQVSYYHGNGSSVQLKESTPRYRNGTAAAPADHRDHQVPWSSSILRDVSNHYYHGNGSSVQLKESTPRYRNGTAAIPAGHGDEHQMSYRGHATSPPADLEQAEALGLCHLSPLRGHHGHAYLACSQTPGADGVRFPGADGSGLVLPHRNHRAPPPRRSVTSASDRYVRAPSRGNSGGQRRYSAPDQPRPRVLATSGGGRTLSSSSEGGAYGPREAVRCPRASSDRRRSAGVAVSRSYPRGGRQGLSGAVTFCSSDGRRATGFEPSTLQGGELATSMPDLRRETVVLSHNAPAKVSGAGVSLCLSVCLSVSLSLPLFVSVSLCLCLSVDLFCIGAVMLARLGSLSLSLYVCLSHSLTFALCLSLIALAHCRFS